MIKAISRGLDHQGIPASIKLSKSQDKLELIPIPIRFQVSLTIV